MKKTILKYILVISSSLLISLGISCKAEVPVDPSPAIVDKVIKTLELPEFTEENNRVCCSLPSNMNVDGNPVKLDWTITSTPNTHSYRGNLLTINKDLVDVNLKINVKITCNSASKTKQFDKKINKATKFVIKNNYMYSSINFISDVNNEKSGKFLVYSDSIQEFNYSDLNADNKTFVVSRKDDNNEQKYTYSYKINNKKIEITAKLNREDWTKSNGYFVSVKDKTQYNFIDNKYKIKIKGQEYNVSEVTKESFKTTNGTKTWTVTIPEGKDQIVISSGNESYTLDFVGCSLLGFSFG